MLKHFVFIFLIFNLQSSFSSEKKVSLEVDNKDRFYRVYVPSNYDGSTEFPLVMVFHGGGKKAHLTPELTDMNYYAEKFGFIVVYPEGSGRRFFSRNVLTWNAGMCCGYAQKKKIDDIQFVSRLLDELQANYRIKQSQVYATGISNGAMLAYRLSCEIPERFTAIAVVAGSLETLACQPRNPIPVMIFHGTNDKNIPYGGGKGEKTRSGVSYQSVDDTMIRLTDLHQCKKKPTITRVKDAIRKSYTCKRGGPVILNKVLGGGHMWPGGTSEKTKVSGGDILASKHIVNFFLSQEK